MTIDRLTVLVTGGAGMIGSHLVDTLLARGCQVSVVDNLSSGYRDSIPTVSDECFYPLDIAQDASLDALFERRFDVVFHLAANFANRNSVDHPVRDLLTNGLGILKILDCCRRFEVPRFVYASSSCVYGNAAGPMDETTLSFDPGTPYAITKLLGEQYTQFYSSYHKLSTVSLRYFNCYGPRERPGRYRNVIPNFLYSALNGQTLTVTGDGDETRDFCYVSDIVNGTILASEQGDLSGESFNLATGSPTRIVDLAERINRLTGNSAGINLVGRRDWDHVAQRQPSIRKAQTILGFKATASLDQGLERTLSWMQKNWKMIQNQMDAAV